MIVVTEVAQIVKNLPAVWETGFGPWIGKIPWRREWLPTPVFLPRDSHGQRSLAGYSPWGCKELDTTEQLTLTFMILFLNMSMPLLLLGFPFGSLC